MAAARRGKARDYIGYRVCRNLEEESPCSTIEDAWYSHVRIPGVQPGAGDGDAGLTTLVPARRLVDSE